MSKLINISSETSSDIRIHLAVFIADESNLIPEEEVTEDSWVTESFCLALIDSLPSKGGLWVVQEEHTNLAIDMVKEVIDGYTELCRELTDDEEVDERASGDKRRAEALIAAASRVLSKLTT